MAKKFIKLLFSPGKHSLPIEQNTVLPLQESDKRPSFESLDLEFVSGQVHICSEVGQTMVCSPGDCSTTTLPKKNRNTANDKECKFSIASIGMLRQTQNIFQ